MGNANAFAVSLIDSSRISETTFIEKYLELLDPVDAVEAALLEDNPDFLADGAKPDDLRKIANGLLSRIPVVESLNTRLTEAIQRQQYTTAQWVLEQAREVFERCMQTKPIRDADGNPLIGPFQPVPALRALDIIGKHVDVQAFKETLELEVGPNLAQAMDAARRRAEQAAKATIEQDDAEVEDGEYTEPDTPEQRRLTAIDPDTSDDIGDLLDD